MFLKDRGTVVIYMFSQSLKTTLFMWFKQQLPWKAYPLNCGDILMSRHSPEERQRGHWVLTVTFQQSETLIDHKRKAI